MDAYAAKSVEELRWEDYQRHAGVPPPTGAAAPAPALGGFFGAPAPAPGGFPFGTEFWPAPFRTALAPAAAPAPGGSTFAFWGAPASTPTAAPAPAPTPAPATDWARRLLTGAVTARVVTPSEVCSARLRLHDAWRPIIERQFALFELESLAKAAPQIDAVDELLRPMALLGPRLHESSSAVDSWRQLGQYSRTVAIVTRGVSAFEVDTAVDARVEANRAALSSVLLAIDVVRGSMVLAGLSAVSAEGLGAIDELALHSSLLLSAHASDEIPPATCEVAAVDELERWLAASWPQTAATLLADFTPATSFCDVAAALTVFEEESWVTLRRRLVGRARGSIRAMAAARTVDPERHAMLAQAYAALREDRAQLEAELEAATALSGLRDNLPGLQAAARDARSKCRKARFELEEAADEGGAVSAEMSARMGALQECAAQAQRAVEGAAARVRELAARGLAEAIAMEVQLVPHATPSSAGGFDPLRAPASPGGSARATLESDLARTWRLLLAIGLAHEDRHRADYEGLTRLAAGRFPVYAARLRGTSRRVVLKEFGGADSAVLVNEVRALRSLEHPHVIALEALFMDGPHVYLQMPLIEGGPLDAWLAAAPRSLGDRLRVFRGVASAVAYLHARRVVHRDLKPSNVLLRADGSPVVADFGISLALDSALATALPSTLLGRGAGTRAYKSPEQLREQRPGPSSDVYALGLLLHDLLFDAPYPAPIEERAARAPAARPLGTPPASVVPPAQAHVAEAATSLLRCLLAASPEDRPLAAAVLADPLCDPALMTSAPLPPMEALPPAGDGATAPTPAQQRLQERVATVRRHAAPALANATILRATVPLDADVIVASLAPDVAAACGRGFAPPWRLSLTLAGADATVDTERALDAFAAACMRPALGAFETSSAGGDDFVAPFVLPAPSADADTLRAFGAVLAQAALLGVSLDVIPRLHPLTWAVLTAGAADVARSLAASATSALAALDPWDPALARGFRQTLLLPGTGELLVALPGWRGTEERLTDANKEDAIRRSIVHALMSVRLASWEALRTGFLAAGGTVVLAAVSQEAAAGAAAGAGAGAVGGAATSAASTSTPVSLDLLLYDRGLPVRRARNSADNAASEAEVRRIAQPCSRCGVLTYRDGGCPHMTCTRCGHHWNWRVG
jgi:hypothetical protein